eukprot:6199008-Pleurochrysis_carterae.AAC.2
MHLSFVNISPCSRKRGCEREIWQGASSSSERNSSAEQDMCKAGDAVDGRTTGRFMRRTS